MRADGNFTSTVRMLGGDQIWRVIPGSTSKTSRWVTHGMLQKLNPAALAAAPGQKVLTELVTELLLARKNDVAMDGIEERSDVSFLLVLHCKALRKSTVNLSIAQRNF